MQMWKLIAAALYGASAVRQRRAADGETTKFIGHVPILNYHLAYQKTSSSLVEGESEKEDWVVVMKKEVKDEVLDNLCTYGKCLRMGHPSEGGVPFFEIHGSEEELESIVNAAGNDVKFIEPDSEVQMTPDVDGDESSDDMWGLDRIGVRDRPSQGEGVNVYVFDTGVRATHNDFGGRVVPALDMTTGTLKECNGDLGCAGDAKGHGTHCAGSAAGTNYGVASKATIRTVKVLGDSGGGDWSWVYDALDWLATKGARPAVASMSLFGKGLQSAMKTAVDSAVESGVVVVVCAGNDNSDTCDYTPGFIPNAIAVGSITDNDEKSSFSNYGSCTDIWAPGSYIVSAAHTSDSGRLSKSGTSMACPLVSGAAALVLEASPNMAPSDILAALLKNAATNAIEKLSSSDTNTLLYVGAGGAPPTPAPATCPENSTGPDFDGDCECNKGLYCYENGSFKCTYSGTQEHTGNTRSRNVFSPSCADCVCKP